MEEQFEKMAADLEDYQQKMVEAEENAEKAAEIAREAKAQGPSPKTRARQPNI